MSNVQKYVLLPVRGLESEELRQFNDKVHQPSFNNAFNARLAITGEKSLEKKPGVKVLHSLHENGPKLVEMGSEAVNALRVSDPGVRAVPVVYYYQQRHLVQLRSQYQPSKTSAVPAISLLVVDAQTQAPLAGATVIAFTDYAKRQGAMDVTDTHGEVKLAFGSASKKLDALVIRDLTGYWGLCKRAITVKDQDAFGLQAVDLTVPDYVEKLYGITPRTNGDGVRVGVIDSGIDLNHPDLTVSGGKVFVVDEGNKGTHGPALKQGEHGTHVAGIIGSRGAAPSGKRGVAPGVTLFSYRVFPNDGGGAQNYDIIRAIDQGVADGCDLLNLSLGGDYADDAVHEAIKVAYDKGTVCIIAAGNGFRAPVAFPAAWPEASAVSAAGDQTTFPPDSLEILDIVPPPAKTDKDVFIAAFSNVGSEIDFTGPGVGIVSTMPGGAYGVMSGTSMACPAVAGVLAALLSNAPGVYGMPRDRARSIAIQGLATLAAKPLGFDREFEGLGLPT